MISLKQNLTIKQDGGRLVKLFLKYCGNWASYEKFINWYYDYFKGTYGDKPNKKYVAISFNILDEEIHEDSFSI